MAVRRSTERRQEPATDSAVLEALGALHAASQVFRARADENAAVSGGNFARTQVLAQLLDGPRSVPAVARGLSLTRQSVQAVMDRLLDAGLVERVPNPEHRSSPRFAVTPEGIAVMDGVRTRAARMHAAIAADFSAADLAALSATLHRLRDLALATPGPTAATPGPTAATRERSAVR